MLRTIVSSTNLNSVGYDEDKRILEVEFQGGSVYRYFGIPEQIYLALMSADSHGSYFNRNIKKASYLYKRVA